MSTILVVDKNINNHKQETDEWGKHGIGVRRVYTMSEAILLLTHNDEYLFIGINEDTLPDFTSQLHVMRDVTNTPIFVITSSYTVKKEIKALQHGADVYSPFGDSAEENVLSGLELLKTKNKWAGRRLEPCAVLTGGSIILSLLHRIVIAGDKKVSLTKNECGVLCYLMKNSNHFVPHTKLLKEVWGETYGEHDTAVLWQTVDRVRKKLAKIPPANKHIIVERGVGYMFSSL
ncbi:MAG: winged helix-turn-helix domain-containing protein [Oscillospiraceae bacterium]|nr:winged helix-turn-helix domain-containing protein [Oscillospiraceae bacterium]